MDEDSYLLDFQNIPDNIISGLDSNELMFVSKESNNRFVNELDPQIMDDLNAILKDNELKDLSSEEKEYIKRLETESIPKSTQKDTESSVRKFKKFLKQKGFNENFEEIPKSFLNKYLCLFYAELRKNDGNLFAPTSLICIRAGIHRHLTSPDVNRDVDILHGSDFKRCNAILKAMIGEYLRTGNERKESFVQIEETDLNKIQDYFRSSNTLSVLQDEVLYNIIYFFQLRGRENLRLLKKDTFEVGCVDGKKCVLLRTTLLHKNVKASLSSKEFIDIKKAKMYESEENCPVTKFEEYVSQLPIETKENTLFPLITRTGKMSSTALVGKDKLGNLMTRLSQVCHLSRKYTNHCLRVTGVNALYQSGLSPAEICSVTGHKNTLSIQRYIRTTEKAVEKASHVLSSKRVVTSEIPSTSSSDETIGQQTEIQLSQTKYMKIKRNERQTMGCESDNEIGVKNKKMRLTTSWGTLEIDL